MSVAGQAWIIAALPLIAFLIIGAGARRAALLSGWLTILTIGAATLIALFVFWEVTAGTRVEQSYIWLPLGNAQPFSVGFQVDPLTATMLVVVSSVSLLVQIYSLGYMAGDPGFARYFAFMALFTFSMLGLVLANNLLALYIFWELVGLCSYLLIGHWHERPAAAAAAKKAFIVTRFGDFGFLAGILFLYWHANTLQINELVEKVAAGQIPESALTVGMLLIFCGAVGKSAQFPLHAWLPDAMEGPTPVSALIHAATMVAAGVYLMARTFPLLEHSATALLVVASVGGFTAIFAATMALVSTDIKRVLAYSTMSQLGYMMLAIGLGAVAAGMFHLVNHAFFKALLFLCAGSVIHLADTNEMPQMGGLGKERPLTFTAMGVGALSLAGIVPLSGFWSKDEILGAAVGSPLLFATSLVTVFLTAAYMFRAIFLTFTGMHRGPVDDHGEPASMALPLVVLLVPTVASGIIGIPALGSPITAFLAPSGAPAELNPEVAAISTLVALGGIGLAALLYAGGRMDRSAILQTSLRPIHTLLINRYYVDHVYNWLAGGVVLGTAWLADSLDRYVIDGIANGLGAIAVGTGGWLRQAQTGQAQVYAWTLLIGVVALAMIALLPIARGG